MTAPRASPSGSRFVQRHRSICGVEVERSGVHGVLLQSPAAPSRAVRSSATYRAASSGPPPVSTRRTSALPTITPSAAPRSCHRLRGRRDPHTEQHGHVGGRLAPPTHLDRFVGECRPLAGHAEQRHAVHEAARPFADRAKSRVGRRGRGEEDGFDPGGVGGVSPTVELVQGQVGDDRAVDAGVGELGGEPLRPGVGDDVVVRHDQEGDAHFELSGFGDDLRRSGAEIEGALRRLLDRASVHDGIGERDADLDGVGARVGNRSHHVEPARAETARDVRREQRAPGVASRR